MSVTLKRMLMVVLLLVCSVPVALLATGSPEPKAQPVGTQTLPEVTLNFMFFNLEPNKYQEMLAELEKRAKNTLNIKMKWDFIPYEDYPTKLKLRLSAGEAVDSAFDAPWWMMNDMISKGNYNALDDYFGNDKYPGLKKAFPPEFINSNRFADKIYGIPFTMHFSPFGETAFSIDKELRQKYFAQPLKSREDLAAFCAQIVKNEPGIIPIAAQGARDIRRDLFMEENIVLAAKNHIFRMDVGNGIACEVLLSSDDKRLLAVTFDTDPAELYKDYPEPIRAQRQGNWQFHFIRDWYEKGYFEKDVLSQKDPNSLKNAKKCAAAVGPTQADPRWENLYLTPAQQNKEARTYATDYRAWNFQCVPVTSKNVARTMLFYDWMFGNQENHDLVQYGVKGIHWEPVGSDLFRLLPSGVSPTQAYNLLGFEICWNPYAGFRFIEGTESNYLANMKFLLRPDIYYLSPLAGFTLNVDSIKTELAKVAPALTTNLAPVRWGMLENVDSEIQKAHAEAISLGLETIRDAVSKQIAAFLATKR
jgi:putative aldouronate transport system substrate-binding protein